MAITMQGRWTVRVSGLNAAWPQRFTVAGATAGNGTYSGQPATPAVVVDGPQWTVTIEHHPSGQPWRPSAMRLGTPVSAGASDVSVAITSDDSGGDLDFNDLVLSCVTTLSTADYIVYGRARTYRGLCRYNPCFPYPWLVIDSAAALRAVIAESGVADLVTRLYPEEAAKAARPATVADSMAVQSDFRPLMVPLTDAPGSREVGLAVHATAGAKKASLVAARTNSGILPGAAALGSLSKERLIDLARYHDTLVPFCDVEPAPGLLLQFLEYDRTAAELAGGPYVGSGSRAVLGLAVTDELGNYLFRFTQSLIDLAAEVSDVGVGETLANALRPDVIVQVVGNATTPVLFESGLYLDIANVQRINLCFPEGALHPAPVACSGGRAIQAIGRVSTIAGAGASFDSAGRVTITTPSAMAIAAAGWSGTLAMYGCFSGLAKPVVAYTIRHRVPGGAWSFGVQPELYNRNLSTLGQPLTVPANRLGPTDRNLRVDGGAPRITPSYQNIEADPAWLLMDRLHKADLPTGTFGSAAYPSGSGPVEFMIEGYDSSGTKVAGAEDRITLYLENAGMTGSIASISMGAVSPDECALFELTAPNAALTVRFVVDQPDGFLGSYGLGVVYGSGPTSIAVADTLPPAQPTSLAYNPAIHGTSFRGTRNAIAPDGSGYVVAELQAVSGAWLPVGKSFCAFEFAIGGTPRLTDGWSLAGGYQLDSDLVGISYP